MNAARSGTQPRIDQLIALIAADKAAAGKIIAALRLLTAHAGPDQRQRDAVVKCIAGCIAPDRRLSILDAAIHAASVVGLTDEIVHAIKQVAHGHKLVGVRNSAHRMLLAHWERSYATTRKRDAERISEHLARLHIDHFFHHTARANLAEIERQGGLFSRRELERRRIKVRYCSDTSSRATDKIRGTDAYVHLCAQIQPRMFTGRVTRNGKLELVTLQVKVEVATWGPTLFSPLNGVTCYAKFGPDWEDFEAMGWSGTHHDQAELMVFESIPTCYITAIVPFAG